MSKKWFTRFRYNGVWYTSETSTPERTAKRRGEALERGDGKLSELCITADGDFFGGDDKPAVSPQATMGRRAK